MDVCFKRYNQDEEVNKEYPTFRVYLELETNKDDYSKAIGTVWYWDFQNQYVFDAIDYLGIIEFSYDSEMLRQISQFIERQNEKLSETP